MITNLRLSISITLLLAGPVYADTSLHYTVQGDCPAIADSVEISGPLMRIDIQAQGQDSSSIFDGAEDLYTTLLPAQHKYYQVEVDEDALDYTGDVADSTGKYLDNQMQKMQAMLQQQCADLEKKGGSCAAMPDMRSLMQGMAANQPRIEMRDSGHKKSVDGVDCNVFEVLENDIKKQEVCYALAGELPIPEDDRKGLARGLKVMTRYGQAFTGMAGHLGGATPAQAQKPEGLPVAQTCFDPTGQAVGQNALSISQEKIAPDRFDIPSDYSKMSMQDNPANH
ncbi:MAG TPA: hypothetical protein VKM00_05585 [Luteimonas sp.]|nr:hypothetical protein [Luteimonas sp.]